MPWNKEEFNRSKKLNEDSSAKIQRAVKTEMVENSKA